MSERSLPVRLGWTLRDYAKRVWDNSSDDNVLFLAGGIAFNILLASVPFIFLLAAGVTYLVPALYPGQVDTQAAVTDFLDRLMPNQENPNSSIHKMIVDLVRTRQTITFYSAIGFVWFSTRLFGSLRTVLADVFDIENERSIIAGKIFDIQITVVSTILFAASIAISTYISTATSRGARGLVALGLRTDVMSGAQYWMGRLIAFVFIGLMFFALYKFLPIRRVRARAAWVAAGFTAVLFELARVLFALYAQKFNPASLYTGTLTAVIIVVVWTYYAALIFILGGEVGQVYELRRMRKLQREVFTD